ncbi:hypothetical protein CGI77_09590 [Vibrio parahaemolyticus]|uniref:hypothetical protein n=1 Tax=Vibrio parahaemolyticus TaxID=670 RepID=UPI00112225D2|nr:hypothetical protein [Vibrio parahaemolyticus]TOH58844.1 hypothetical protein CGI77_09590 [Vibrio parahaemolyticus]
MKSSTKAFDFLVSKLLAELGKTLKISCQDVETVHSLLNKTLGRALIEYSYDFTKEAQMFMKVDGNKLDYPIESVEELVELVNLRITQAKNTIENPQEETRHSKLIAANQLVKLSGKLGNVVDQQKCAEYEESYKPVENVFPGVSRSSMAFNSGGHPCITTLSVRYDGQDIKCSIDEDTLDEIRDVLIGYQNGDVKVFDVSIEGLKNKLGKYKDVKLVGLEQS